MLEVRDLHVAVGRRRVIRGLSLSIKAGEVHVLMGPNACGKTSLVMAIAGLPSYRLVRGRILFEGEDLSQRGVEERARLGIALAYQSPPEVRGVKLGGLLDFIARRFCPGSSGGSVRWLGRMGLDGSFGDREVNVKFSGGEKKRAELAQVFAMRPRLMMLDEPDSGVDVDSLRLIGREVRRVREELGCAVLLITHHRHILQYLRPDVCHIMYEGRIIASASPEELMPRVEEIGYEALARALEGKP